MGGASVLEEKAQVNVYRAYRDTTWGTKG